ncbi:type II toxin-antitoxin system RatA family toxin [Aliikangiella coralliicola]|uniref:Type II toxin-antitoxin system RatA family toxin n=2 Tax=Aliikangiella coralliicola TaxID=2592383 RepID=A0A545UCP2_9GAMM|nr:type II toxin-antitoxin system RatA family toxin [Aliikangiella coralliicola]
MYQLVDDIEKYPEFVPYCKKSQIHSRSEAKVSATLEVAKSGIAKSFTTQNLLTPHQCIEMTLVDGPFKHLKGGWHFTPLSEEACKIELNLEFEFANKLASFAFANIFNQLVQSMVTAFTERAEKIYG